MNQKTVFPNNPLFFLQFIIFPLIIIFICHKVGLTVGSIIQNLGAIRILILIFAYFLFVAGMVFSSLVVISDEHISGPGTIFNLFPVKHSLIGSECSLEDRRTGRFTCECLIIRNKNKSGEICLPNVYFTYDLFDEITNLIRQVNGQR